MSRYSDSYTRPHIHCTLGSVNLKQGVPVEVILYFFVSMQQDYNTHITLCNVTQNSRSGFLVFIKLNFSLFIKYGLRFMKYIVKSITGSNIQSVIKGTRG